MMSNQNKCFHMRRALMVIIFIYTKSTLCANYTSPSKNLTFTLNSNLVVNPNITTPVISPAASFNTVRNQSGWFTKVLNVEYIDACIIGQQNVIACPSYKGVTCGWQFLDTDSYYSNEQYYQQFNISGIVDFQLQFDWISETSFLLSSTGFRILWNSVIVDSIYDNSCTLKTSTYYLTSLNGLNQFVIAGIGIMDSVGILIRNIRLRQIIYGNSTATATNTSSANTTNTTSANTTNTTTANATTANSTNTTNSKNSTVSQNTTSNSTNSTNLTNTTSTQNSTNTTNSSTTTNSTTSKDVSSNSTNTSSSSNSTTSTQNSTQNTTNSTNTSSIDNSTSSSQNYTSDTSNASNLTNTSTTDQNYTSDTTTNSSDLTNQTEASNSSSSNNTANSSSTDVIDNSTSNTSDSSQTCNTTSRIESNQTCDNTTDMYQDSKLLPTLDTNSSLVNTVINFDNLEEFLNDSQVKNAYRIMNFVKSFQLTKTFNTISTLKQNAKFLIGFMLEFNHLILYNYHILNYTLMSNVILTAMMALDDQKGYFLDTYVYPFLGTSSDMIVSDFDQQNNLPTNINNIISDFMQRPSGVLLQFTDLVCLDLPVMMVMFALGYLGFKLLFRWRISVIFRQYSLLGCFLFMFLEGKIEIVTFYFLSELLLLVNARFEQKLKTTAILVAYFLIFVTAVGGMLILKAKYKKQLKFIFQNCKNPEKQSFHMTFGFGLYNIILGFTHRILIYFPLPQLYLLIFIESIYLLYLIVYLIRCRFDNICLGFTLCCMNCARLIFISTFLYFELYPESQNSVSVIQQYFLNSFLILWGLSSLLSLLQKITLIFQIMVVECKDRKKVNKITPSTTAISLLETQKTRQRQKYSYNLKTKITVTNGEEQEISISLSKGCFRRGRTKREPKKQPIQNSSFSSMVVERKRRAVDGMANKVTFNLILK